MKRMAAVTAALAALLLVAGCTPATAPRESARPMAIPLSLLRFQSDRCLDEIGEPETTGGWHVGIVGAGTILVEVSLSSGARDTSPEARAFEDGMEDCLSRHPILWESEPWAWSEFETDLQYLYYVGPLSSCLRAHGIEPAAAGTFDDYRAGAFPINPYWAMEGELEHLVDVYRDCPPYADLPLESR